MGFHGESRIVAEHRAGVLKARLPEAITVGAAAAAGEATLRSRGYVVTSDRRLQGISTITGRRPAQGLRRHIARQVTFEARLSGGGRTLVNVIVRPFSDEAEARAILSEALALLDA